MNVKKYFQYETRDFPYYNHNPQLSKTAWIVLLLTVPISFMTFGLGMDYELGSSILFCLIPLIPLLYFSKWDYKLLFSKPTRNEIILAALMFIGYMTYAILIGDFLDYLGMYSTTSEVQSANIISLISLISGCFITTSHLQYGHACLHRDWEQYLRYTDITRPKIFLCLICHTFSPMYSLQL